VINMRKLKLWRVKIKTKALTKQDRQDQIVTWFAIRLEKGIDDIASMSQIARGIGVSPSTKLRKIIESIVPDRLEKTELKRQGRWDGIGYRLARRSFVKLKASKRIITLNSSKGKGQLELL